MSASATRYDVFLSHNSADKPAVQALANSLRATGIAPFLDIWHLIPGTPWQEGIEEALEASATVAVFVGPSGISPWHNEEMHDALDRAVRSRDDYRVIPVLLPGADEGSVSRFLARRVWVDFRSGLNDEAALQRLVAGVKGEAVEVGSYQLPDEPAPYRGLLPFEAEHARFFFGRDDDVRRLVVKLGQQRFVAVVGASGSGKSSLVKAGLLPRLAQNALPDSTTWRVLTMTPGKESLRSLANQLATLAPTTAERVRTADALSERLLTQRDGLRTALEAYLAEAPRPVLLCVDQFEELFTQCAEGPERCRAQAEQFVANLADAVQEDSGRIRVLITLRADFLDRCLALPALRGLLEDRQVLLGPMDEPALREAITRPAQEVGALFEKGLVSMILRDVGDEPGRLPLLEHALHELWRARKGPWLTIDAYEVSGGVRGALERRAQTTLEHLSEARQGIARNIFVQLSGLGEGIVDTRRRVDRSELYPVGLPATEVDAVLDVLSNKDARLVVIGEDSVEVAHEALIREWATLRGWLSEYRKALLLQDRLDASVSHWLESNLDPGALARGRFLDDALEWRAAYPQFATERRQRFLEASLALRKQEQRARQRRARLLTVLITIVIILLIPGSFVSANLWMFSRQQRSFWQRTGYPANSVLSIAVADKRSESKGFPICVGTADIGVGCSYDLEKWNISQVGLPTSKPAFLRNRENWLGDLLGSTWSTTIVGVEAIAFDQVSPGQLYASVMNQSGLYTSRDGGASWIAIAEANASSQPMVPTDVSVLAVHGSNLYALRQIGSTNLALEQRGSLHVSHDRGITWQQVGGVGHATGTLRDFALVSEGSEQTPVLYAAGETGLFRSVQDDQWAKLLGVGPGEVARLVAVSDDEVFLVTYDDHRNTGAIQSWIPASNTAVQRWAEFEGRPRFAVADPDSAAEHLIWLLLQDGRVISIDGSGRVEDRGRRPGWPWSTAKRLSVFENSSGGRLILMGHSDGLLQYCPDGACTVVR